MAIASLQVTKTYADGLAWTEARMDTAMQSIQTYTKTSLVNNFNQVIADAFSATYSLDNDGSANYSIPVRTIAVGASTRSVTASNNALVASIRSRTASLNLQQVRKDGWGTAYTLDGDGNANRTYTLYDKQATRLVYTAASIALGTSTNAAATLVSTNTYMLFTPEATGRYYIGYNFSHTADIDNGGDLSMFWQIRNKTTGAILHGARYRWVNSGTTDNIMTHPCHFETYVTLTSTAAATYALYKRITTAATILANYIEASATGMGLYAQIHKI